MSGKKGMKHFGEQIINDVLKMRTEGKTNREISEYYEFKDKEVIKQLLRRYNKKQKTIQAGIVPRRKGRPPKGYAATTDEKDNEIKRLKMENELLRSFLQIAGRK